MSDIIAELRECGTDIAEAAANELQRCHERLEIDHVYRLGPGPDLETIREEVPYERRQGTPDAVTCRDATISLMEEDIAAKDAEIERLREPLRMLFRAYLFGVYEGHPVWSVVGEALGEDEVGQIAAEVRRAHSTPNQAAGATPQPRSEVSGPEDTGKPFRRS